MKTIKKISVLALGLLVFASCGNSKKTSDSDSTSTCTTACQCGEACSCGSDPCTCHHTDDAADSTAVNGQMISYFANGMYRFIKMGDDASTATMFDENKNEMAKGQIVKDETTDEKLVYSFDDGCKVTILLNEPRMECNNDGDIMDFVLISPSQSVYTSGDNTIKAIYNPEVSVTLISKEGLVVLAQGEAHAKGAEYTDGKTTWSTQMNEATLTKDGETTKFTTDGKATLPKVVIKK